MIDTLTALRFFAALGVFLHHSVSIIAYGNIGVAFFFVLSGFILTYNYHNKFEKINASNLKDFYLSRFARIYPVHALTLLIALPISHYLKYNFTSFETFLNVFLLQSYYPNGQRTFSLNGVSWSISTEMFFYLVFPFLMYGVSKIKRKHLILFSWIIIMVVAIYIPKKFNNPTYYDVGNWITYVSPFYRIVDFINGMFLGIIFISIKSKSTDKIVSKLLFSFLEIAPIVAMIVMHHKKMYYLNLTYALYYLPLIDVLIFAFAFQKGIISIIIKQKLFVHFGEISYSMYMIHALIMQYIAAFISSNIYSLGNDVKSNVFRIFLLIVTLCVSHVMYKYFESPMRRVIKNYFSRNKEPIKMINTKQKKRAFN